MKKYKFAVGDRVYPTNAYKIYLSTTTKKRQKGVMTVLHRMLDGEGKAVYLCKTEDTKYGVHLEDGLTKNKEEILGYIIVKPDQSVTAVKELPVEVEPSWKVLTVMGTCYA